MAGVMTWPTIAEVQERQPWGDNQTGNKTKLATQPY